MLNQLKNYIDLFIGFAMGLSPTEITVLVIILGLLVLYLVYRHLGLGAVLALSVVYAVAYIVYTGGIFKFYEKKQIDEGQREKVLWEELQKQ